MFIKTCAYCASTRAQAGKTQWLPRTSQMMKTATQINMRRCFHHLFSPPPIYPPAFVFTSLAFLAVLQGKKSRTGRTVCWFEAKKKTRTTLCLRLRLLRLFLKIQKHIMGNEIWAIYSSSRINVNRLLKIVKLGVSRKKWTKFPRFCAYKGNQAVSPTGRWLPI